VCTRPRVSHGRTTSRCPTRQRKAETRSDLAAVMGGCATTLGLPADGPRGTPMFGRYRPGKP
jgi:hypothetical protein